MMPPMSTDTIMAAAFLKALRTWPQRHHASGMIAISSGRVDIGELVKVIATEERVGATDDTTLEE
jgi:hypothetical protein